MRARRVHHHGEPPRARRREPAVRLALLRRHARRHDAVDAGRRAHVRPRRAARVPGPQGGGVGDHEADWGLRGVGSMPHAAPPRRRLAGAVCSRRIARAAGTRESWTRTRS